METYAPDIDASQIVRWLIEEQERGRSTHNVFASRTYAIEDVEDREIESFGEEESQELSDVIVIGHLEIHPASDADGWVLRLRAVDRLGPRLPDGLDVPDTEEEITLEAFEEQFILPEHVAVDVSLEAENSQAKARFTRLFRHMLKNEHSPASKD